MFISGIFFQLGIELFQLLLLSLNDLNQRGDLSFHTLCISSLQTDYTRRNTINCIICARELRFKPG
jgi:hypothetical protein